MIKSIVLRRIKAFAIDYLIILLYIGLLLATTLLVSRVFSVNIEKPGPVSGQLIGFFTLTLPVILYFTISENSKKAGTIGKRTFHLQVVSNNFTKVRFGQLLIRNSVKFLPWEMAHFFVFRLFYFARNNAQTPDWVLAGLIASQGIALLYLIYLIVNKNNRSLYELLSQTRVIQMKNG